MQRLDAQDILLAGSFLERQLLQALPTVYNKSYAPLWAEEGDIIPVVGQLQDYAHDVESRFIEGTGKALEYVDRTNDIPIVSRAIGSDRHTVHMFSIATEHSIRELAAMRQLDKDIPNNASELAYVNRALRQSVHELLVYGSAQRSRTGLINNINVPTTLSGYNPNTTTFQQDVDFISNQLTAIQDRNTLAGGSTGYILLTNKLRAKYARTYELGGGGRSVLEAIIANFGTATGGTLKGFKAVNEVRATFLERFGVKPVGANQERMVFIPDDSEAIQRLAGASDFLQPQPVDLRFRTIHFLTTTETIIIHPQSLQYVDFTQML